MDNRVRQDCIHAIRLAFDAEVGDILQDYFSGAFNTEDVTHMVMEAHAKMQDDILKFFE